MFTRKLALPALGLALLLEGCIFGSSDSPPKYNPDPNLPPGPDVSYSYQDSIVSIAVTGDEAGDENTIWVFRNGVKRAFPRPTVNSAAPYYYYLVDTVPAPGVYQYFVQLGTSKDSLGNRSETFAFEYLPKSRTGIVTVSALSNGKNSVTLRAPAGSMISKVRFMRRVGAYGAPELLDSVTKSTTSLTANYTDTDSLALDGFVYYRAYGFDVGLATWLEPTAWASIKVNNKTWKFTPVATLSDLGTSIQVQITNYTSTSGITYYLMRNATSSASGATAVDSSKTSNGYDNILEDVPPTGKYYYWVQAVDALGRQSTRSTPQEVNFDGKPRGPSITSISASGSSLIVYFTSGITANNYILYRTADTTVAPVAVDTAVSYSFTDVPPSNGYWYYRIVATLPDSSLSEPGYWMKSPLYSFTPQYYSFTASFQNKGDKVQATVSTSSLYWFIMYRSKASTGADSVPVDTVRYNSPTPGLLEDVPTPGTWYYRIYRFYDPSQSSSTNVYRTEWVKMDFTGRPQGPAVSLSVYGAYVQLTISPDADALAYVVERTADTTGGGSWTTVDTVASTSPTSYATFQDRPPSNGYWYYRVKSIRKDLSLTDPGPVMRTSSSWTYTVNYYSLSATLENKGSKVQVQVSNSTLYFYVLYRSKSASGADSTAADTAVYDAAAGYLYLEDAPAVGTWYYRVYRFYAPGQSSSNDVYRSEWMRVDFTGKEVGPSVSSLTNYPTYIQVYFPVDTAGLAYIVERAPDSGAFVAVDTLTGPGYSTSLSLNDRPPSDGYWQYRIRRINKDMSVTDPGVTRRTSTAWTYTVNYSNSLSVTLVNTGFAVEVTNFSATSSYNYYLLRGPKDDYTTPTIVDSLKYQDTTRFMDAPAKGTYYYWVERWYATSSSSTVYRSVPQKVEFTGAPEITALTQNTSGVTLTFGAPTTGDTLEIWRSTTSTTDSSAFTVLTKVSTNYTTSFLDASVSKTAAAFYHYRLTLIRGGNRTPMGAVKSIYYSP